MTATRTGLNSDTDVGSVGIVGAGRLGSSLAAGLNAAGYRVTSVASQHFDSALAVAESVGVELDVTTDLARVAELCSLVFLTVPDRALAAVCASVVWHPGQHVVHCSGALGLDVLDPVRAAGGFGGILHPLQTFPTTTPAPERFEEIFCGVESDDPLSPILNRIVERLGARVLPLAGVDRALYHSAAVFVSNDVVALVAAARRAWVLAGLPEEVAAQALAPLLKATAENIDQLGLRRALSGPIARGDVGTVQKHMEALELDADLAELYRNLAQELLRLPLGHDEALVEQMRRALGPS